MTPIQKISSLLQINDIIHIYSKIKQFDKQRTIEELSSFIDEFVVDRSKDEKSPLLDENTGEIVELTEKTFAAYLERKGLTFVVCSNRNS